MGAEEEGGPEGGAEVPLRESRREREREGESERGDGSGRGRGGVVTLWVPVISRSVSPLMRLSLIWRHFKH